MACKFKVGDRVVVTVGQDVTNAVVTQVGPIPGGYHYEVEDDQDQPDGYLAGPYPVYEEELVLLTEEAAA